MAQQKSKPRYTRQKKKPGDFQKKKPGDFKRPKRKVGRKIAPNNLTNASIQSRRINLTMQSVLQDKTGAAVTHRNQALPDILSKMTHYNAQVRRDSIFSLKELVLLHSTALMTNVAAILERLLQAMADDEAVVREAGIVAWKVCLSSLSSSNSEKALAPFVPLISVYFCSGLTHIKVGVREDTLKYIDALMDISVFATLMANSLSSSDSGRLLENFKDLIAPKATVLHLKNSYSLLAEKAKDKQAQLQTRVLKHRFFAVKTLHKYLLALSSASTKLCDEVQNRDIQVISCHTLLMFPEPVIVDWNHQQVSNQGNVSWPQKAITLLPPLLALWLECHTDDSWNHECLKHMTLIVECAVVIVRSLHQDMETSIVICLLEAFFAEFPKHSPESLTNDMSCAQLWDALNTSIAEFGCECLDLQSNSFDLKSIIASYIKSSFQRLTEKKEYRSTNHQGRLNVLHTLLRRENQPELLLGPFTELYDSCSPSSSLFRSCSIFAIEYLHSTLEHMSGAMASLASWELTLKWMSRFGVFLLLPPGDSSHEANVLKLFRVCNSILKRLPDSYVDLPCFTFWQKSLVVFFTNASDTFWFGKLEAAAQVAAISLLYHLPKYPSGFLRTLAQCCKSPSVSVDAKSHLLDIIAQNAACNKLDRASVLSFYMSALFAEGNINQSLSPQVSRLLGWMNLGISLSSILAPLLSKQDIKENTQALVLAYVACLKSSATVFVKAGQAMEKRATPQVLQPRMSEVFAHVLATESPLIRHVIEGIVHCNGVLLDVIQYLTTQASNLSSARSLLRQLQLRPFVVLYKAELQNIMGKVVVDVSCEKVTRQLQNELKWVS